MPEHADLVLDLGELGRSVPTPEAPRLEAAVMARVGEPSRRPFLARPHARLVAAVVAVLLALLAAPPVRAAVADWFGFGSVVVRHGDGDGSPSDGSVSPPTLGPGTSLAEAAAQVDFVVFELPWLGDPAGAKVSLDRRVLSVGWTGGIRLDQSSSLSYTFDKTADSVETVSVRGHEALWFADSHEVVLLDTDGARIEESRRPAARTLIWTIGDTTLRLEGDLSLEQALAAAASARRLD